MKHHSFFAVKFSSPLSARSVNKDVLLWHYRLGHLGFRYQSKMFPHLMNKDTSHFSCDICQFSEHTKVCYKPHSHQFSKPFNIVHSDIWGPSRFASLSNAKWFVTFIDDHTRLTWVFLMKEKSDLPSIFMNFHKMITTQFQTSILML